MPDLTSLERQVLGALVLEPDAQVADRTIPSVAERAGLEESDVRRTLEQLEAAHPEWVHRDREATTGEEFWIATPPGDDPGTTEAPRQQGFT